MPARRTLAPAGLCLFLAGCSSRTTTTGETADGGGGSRVDARESLEGGTRPGAKGDGGHDAQTNRRSDAGTTAVVPESGAADAPVSIPHGERASAADDFVDSIGVNTHLAFTGEPYTSGYANVKTLLVASGIRHFRDGLVTGNASYKSNVLGLTQSGLTADVITAPTEDAGTIQTFAASLGGAMDALESPNEWNTNGGTMWVSTLKAYLPVLDQAVTMSPLVGVPVIGPSLTSESAYGDLGDVSSLVAFGNLHCYLPGFMPETKGWGATDGFGTYGALTTSIAWGTQAFAHLADWVTEFGYGTEPSTKGQVPLDVQGKYTVRAAFKLFQLGVRRTYFYQFMDQGGVADGFGYYGLVAVDPSDLTGNVIPFSPKPSYVALSAILAELADRGPSWTPGELAVQFSSDGGEGVEHVLLEKRNGTFYVVFWLPLPVWDPNAGTTGSYTPVTPESVSLSVGRSFSSAKLTSFDPSSGAASSEAQPAATGSFLLTATDTVQILELTP